MYITLPTRVKYSSFVFFKILNSLNLAAVEVITSGQNVKVTIRPEIYFHSVSMILFNLCVELGTG